MNIFQKAAGVASRQLINVGSNLVNVGAKYLRPESIGAFVSSADGRVQRNQSGDRIVVAPRTLRRLAMYDPVMGSILRKFKTRITKMGWDVGTDCTREITELHRLEKLAAGFLSPYAPDGWKPNFESEILDSNMTADIWKLVSKLAKDDRSSRMRARWVFDQAAVELQAAKAGPAYKAEQFLKSINKDNAQAFKFTLSRWIDDLLIVDAGAGPKVRSLDGGILECYAIPGEEVVRFINPDLSTPQPPYRAFRWERNGFYVADYTSEDMLYMVKNPQPNGYGFSPLEMAITVITASLYADTYNIDSFKSNLPPAIMDLGNIPDAQRIRFRTEWENELHRGGPHRLMFVNSTKGGQMNLHDMKGLTQKEMQYMEYIKWTLRIKCMCAGLAPQDIGFIEDLHRTAGETQQAISTEGMLDMADFLEKEITSGLVAPFFGTGISFKFIRDQQVMSKEQMEVHTGYLNAGVLTRNQVLEMIGQRPLAEGGDVAYMVTRTEIIPVDELYEHNSATELREEPDVDAEQQESGEVESVGAGTKPPTGNQQTQKALDMMRGTDSHVRMVARKAMKEAKDNRKGRVDRFKSSIKEVAEKVKADAVQTALGKE